MTALQVSGAVDSLSAYSGVIGPLLWLIIGILSGVFLAVTMAGTEMLRETLLHRILQSNRDGWAIVQRGQKYDLVPLDRDEDTAAWTSEDDGQEEEEWFTDPADKLHTWHGVPVGLALEGQRPVVDVETAAAAEGAADQLADGGQLVAEDTLTIEEIQDRLGVGTLSLGNGRAIQYVNPYIQLPRSEFVDLRNITKLLRYDSGSDTPRKAAKNAVEAEQALSSDYGDIKEFGKIITAFMLGAIATYIGVTGGGGGGGTSVGVMISMGGLL